MRRTRLVAQDLEQIVDYIARDNLVAALDWLDATEAVFQLIATQPVMGQICQTKRFKRLRRHPLGSYYVYYRPIAGGIEVIRVIHQARDEANRL